MPRATDHGYRVLARSELPVDTTQLARYLIGKVVVRTTPEGVLSGRIVETEAYPVGDAAGHAFRGETARTHALFLDRGHAYVYLAYGLSWMLNVSSEAAGVGAGVLIRALSPLEGIATMQRNRLSLLKTPKSLESIEFGPTQSYRHRHAHASVRPRLPALVPGP